MMHLQDATSDDLLDMLAEQYRGKPIPDEWDPETHPLFMEDVEVKLVSLLLVSTSVFTTSVY